MEDVTFLGSLLYTVIAASLAAASFGYFYVTSFVAVVAMLLLSAIISASEVAFFSIKASDLDRYSNSEDAKSKRVATLMSTPRQLLATILILNNLVNVSIITLSTFIMWEIAATRQPEKIIVGIVTFGVTFFVTLFGEIIPKVYAKRHNLAYARFMSGIWNTMQRVCQPVSWLLLNMGSVVENRFKKKGYSLTVKEINEALELTADNDNATKREKDILKGIVNFGTLTVKQIMKSRVDIFALPDNLTLKELIKQVKKSGFSRIPIYNETLDKIRGVLYVKDLLPYLNEPAGFEWQKMIRICFFVPETKKLDALLKDFQGKKTHIAMIVDEYGGTSGLVTLEDLIEEIIGEINDEFDEESIPFVRINDNTFVFEGKTLLHDFCKAVRVSPSILDPVKGESESLGGLLLELNSTMPKKADKITFDRFVFTVLSADQKKIERIRIVVNEPTKPIAL